LTLLADYGVLTEIAGRVLPGSGPPSVSIAPGGASTPVFRIERHGVTLYLRLAESADASLAPEVRAHELCRARGARVPEVVHFDPFHSVLGRSVMVTTAIPGGPLGGVSGGTDITEVRAAGRDLALINSIPVDGYGWVRRDLAGSARLEAQHSSLSRFAFDEVEAQLSDVTDFLNFDEIETIRLTFDRCAGLMEDGTALLAHGDFDATHIFQHQGIYSGIIDFGEIRGADTYYDLGHFALHDGERIQTALLSQLIDGYREVTPLPADAERRILFWSLLIGVRALARTNNRPLLAYRQHLLMAVRRALRQLQND
jgi:aminoglycoside phosphotransferase (APT) family kinase protein